MFVLQCFGFIPCSCWCHDCLPVACVGVLMNCYIIPPHKRLSSLITLFEFPACSLSKSAIASLALLRLLSGSHEVSYSRYSTHFTRYSIQRRCDQQAKICSISNSS